MSIKKINHFLKAYIKYTYLKRSENSKNKKAIIITIVDYRIYNRHFYTFIKFFALSGYSIYFPEINFTYYKV